MADVAVQINTSPEAPIDQERGSLTQGQLIWRRFLRNRLAVAGGIVVLIFYVVMVVFPGFFSTIQSNGKTTFTCHLSGHNGLMKKGNST